MAGERVEKIGDATLYLGDCREVLPTLSSVDAAVTSPPYDSLRAYGGHERVNVLAVINHIANLLRPGGVCVWNVADQTIDGSETGSSFRQALHALECGLLLHDTMIYCKEGVTFPDSNRYHPAFEYMFVFSKGAPRHFNGIEDWPNKWGGTLMHGTDRQPDGSTTKTNGAGVREVKKIGLRRNWWIISNPYVGHTDGHPAPMPYAMARDHILTWTAPGDIVLDPFMGSGTTGIACARLGRKFIGIEVHEPFFEIATRRLREFRGEVGMFAPTATRPDAPVQAPLFEGMTAADGRRQRG